MLRPLHLTIKIVKREITRPFAPWIGQELRETIKEKNMLQLKLKNDRSNQLLDSQFKQNKKDVEKLLNNAKKNHFKEKFSKCKGNSGGTWRVVGEMIPDLKGKSKSVIFDDPSKKANEFNEYFSKIGEIAFQKSQEGIQERLQVNASVSASASNNNSMPLLPPSFRPQPVDIDTVILVFKDLNESNAFGSDGISFKYLKDALPVLIFYITVIVNTSIVTGVFAKLWKHPHVIPYFKSGDTENVGNYRPISLLPVLSKVLEKNRCSTTNVLLRVK